MLQCAKDEGLLSSDEERQLANNQEVPSFYATAKSPHVTSISSLTSQYRQRRLKPGLDSGRSPEEVSDLPELRMDLEAELDPATY